MTPGYVNLIYLARFVFVAQLARPYRLTTFWISSHARKTWQGAAVALIVGFYMFSDCILLFQGMATCSVGTDGLAICSTGPLSQFALPLRVMRSMLGFTIALLTVQCVLLVILVVLCVKLAPGASALLSRCCVNRTDRVVEIGHTE